MMKTLTEWLLAAVLVMVLASSASAQSGPDPAGGPGPDDAAAASDTNDSADSGNQSSGSSSAPAGRQRKAGEYPPNPKPFYRGNVPTGSGGFYLSLFRLVPVLGILFLWIWSGNWADEDSQSLKVQSDFWNSWILVGGMAGFCSGSGSRCWGSRAGISAAPPGRRR